MKDFKIGIRDFDKVLKKALAQTYSFSPEFANESDFKHELFHQLHGMEINGHRLGDRLPGYATNILHAEARPRIGLNRRADLLICNPTVKGSFNYEVEAAIELKLTLDADDLKEELIRVSEYTNEIRKLYFASANNPKMNRAVAKNIISEHQPMGATVDVLDRNTILGNKSKAVDSKSRRKSRAKTLLAERVAKCVTATLNLYGKNRADRCHGFFWRNWEYETKREWTFPSEGDFVAQLYHRLRSRLRQSATIRTEYSPLSAFNSDVDVFVNAMDETVGIEVKMNYDNIYKYNRDDTPKLSRRFNAMSREIAEHTNFLVVIQGEHAYAKDNKAIALEKLRKCGSDFSLLYFDEIRDTTIGPVSVEEAQELAIR